MQTNKISWSVYADMYVWEKEQSTQSAENYRQILLNSLKIAMDIYKMRNPAGYELISEFYLGEKITFAELGRRHGIAVSTAYEKLFRNIQKLRKLTFEILDNEIYSSVSVKNTKKS